MPAKDGGYVMRKQCGWCHQSPRRSELAVEGTVGCAAGRSPWKVDAALTGTAAWTAEMTICFVGVFDLAGHDAAAQC